MTWIWPCFVILDGFYCRKHGANDNVPQYHMASFSPNIYFLNSVPLSPPHPRDHGAMMTCLGFVSAFSWRTWCWCRFLKSLNPETQLWTGAPEARALFDLVFFSFKMEAQQWSVHNAWGRREGHLISARDRHAGWCLGKLHGNLAPSPSCEASMS